MINNPDKYVYRLGQMTTDVGSTGQVDTNTDVMVVDCRDLRSIIIAINQLVAGTGTLALEGTFDNLNWFAMTGSPFTAGSFSPATPNAVVAQVTQSDSHGMQLPLQAARLRATAPIGGGGAYTIGAVGFQSLNYR